MRVKRIWTLTVTILTETKQIENDRKCYQPRRLVDMLRYYQFDFVQVQANLPLPPYDAAFNAVTLVFPCILDRRAYTDSTARAS